MKIGIITEDIPALAKYFVDYYNTKYGLNFKFSNEHIAAFQAREWPGNVRELENYIHRMVVLQSDSLGIYENVSVGVLRHQDVESIDTIDTIVSKLIDSGRHDLINIARESIEKPLLSKVMSRVRDNQSEAAKMLGISRNTLRKMLSKYGIGS